MLSNVMQNVLREGGIGERVSLHLLDGIIS